MKKGDFAVLGVIAAAAVLLFVLLTPRGAGSTAVIRQDGEVVCRVKLNETRTVTLADNVIEVADGRAVMKSAGCKNQICVHHAAISKAGETIVCLPNAVTVTIE